MISVLVKRAALAIAVFIAYVYILENLLGAVLNYISIKASASPMNYTPYADLLPVNATDSLVPFPFFRELLNKAMPSSFSVVLLLSISLIYLLLYIFISRKRFLTKDL